MYVQEYMTHDPITIGPDLDAADALRTMVRTNVRRLPVLTGHELVGLVTRDTLYAKLPNDINPLRTSLPPDWHAGLTVREFMATELITAQPLDPLEEAAELMREHKIGGLPVIQRERLVGLITESDIFRAFTQLMGAGRKGVRISLRTPADPAQILKVLKSGSVFGVTVNNLAMCRRENQEEVVLTLRVEGRELDRYIRGLWNAGYRVTGVLHSKPAPQTETTDAA